MTRLPVQNEGLSIHDDQHNRGSGGRHCLDEVTLRAGKVERRAIAVLSCGLLAAARTGVVPDNEHDDICLLSHSDRFAELAGVCRQRGCETRCIKHLGVASRVEFVARLTGCRPRTQQAIANSIGRCDQGEAKRRWPSRGQIGADGRDRLSIFA